MDDDDYLGINEEMLNDSWQTHHDEPENHVSLTPADTSGLKNQVLEKTVKGRKNPANGVLPVRKVYQLGQNRDKHRSRLVKEAGIKFPARTSTILKGKNGMNTDKIDLKA
ncbi:MAG: hypothetical protein HQK83_08765 [Fibrobacteria bacterium]|nr:hypothetical protein [Fibrobacteria bacterium]